jgi:hypothetical protein
MRNSTAYGVLALLWFILAMYYLWFTDNDALGIGGLIMGELMLIHRARFLPPTTD